MEFVTTPKTNDAREPTSPHTRRWMLLAAWPVIAAMALSNEPAPLYVLWQDRLGFPDATLTLIYAGYFAGLLVSLSFSGTLSDRYGRRPVLLPGLAIGLVASVLFTVADSVALLGLARLLSGIAVGAALSAGMAAVSDLAPDGRKKLGGLVASTSMVTGAAVGPLLTGVLSRALPHPTVTVFVVQVVLLLVALAVVVRMPLRGREDSAVNGRLLRIPSVPAANRRALLVSLAVFAPAFTASGFVLSLGPSLLGRLLGGDDPLLSGGLISLLFAAATAVQFGVRGLRVPVQFRLGAGLTVVGMVALVAAVAADSVPLLLVAAVLAGCGQGSAQLGGLATLAAEVPSARLAEADSAFTAGGYLLAGGLPVVAGYLSDAVGLTAATAVFGVVVAVLAAAGALAAEVVRA
ncbi:MFS transporter [Lentzea sp. NPDC058436]|uniref:MFS transporter n=1 Tax=Lentzea sp. NPDC058436 TaxID=3346499 RepID=UPI00366336CE